MDSIWRATMSAVLCAAMAACNRGERLSRVNDELRASRAELQAQVQRLTGRVAELESELKIARAVPATLPDEVRANVPHIAKINIGRLSHVRDSDSDGKPEMLVLYLEPEDSRGRFVQLVGTVEVHAAVLPPKIEAATIARATIGPSELRDAYRSGFTGVHYTLETPIQWPHELDATAAGKATVHARYTDGLTGQTFSAERTISLE